jgi:ABC-type thiamine transport system ATPase subunit
MTHIHRPRISRAPNRRNSSHFVCHERLQRHFPVAFENPILLLDEPLSHIHPELKLEILKLIKRIKREFDLTTIYVTHNINKGRYIGDELFVFEDGRLKIRRMMKLTRNKNMALASPMISAER